MWPTVWFCERGNEPVGFIKDAISTVDESFLNERVRKKESPIGLMRSGSGLGGHVIRSDTDGSVSFIVQQLRFHPLICLIHHRSSFVRVSRSAVSVSFCSRIPRSVSSTRSQFPVNMSSSAHVPVSFTAWSVKQRC